MKTETFSYLPPLTAEQVRDQIRYILRNGWIPGVEYISCLDPYNTYWSMWKLPLFSARTPTDVLFEIEACWAANPGCYVKLTGYDRTKQGQVLSFVVYRPDQTAVEARETGWTDHGNGD